MTATATRALVEVDDLDPSGVLDAVADAETAERRVTPLGTTALRDI